MRVITVLEGTCVILTRLSFLFSNTLCFALLVVCLGRETRKEKKKKRGGKIDLEKVGGGKKSESLSSQQGVISSPGSVSEEKLQSLAPVNINFPLNLSTEESGYESDLTRKTSSKVRSGAKYH